MRHYVIGDIHGDYDKLVTLVRSIRKNNGLNFKQGDKLIQLGDRSDRGKDSYRVNNYFYKLQKRYPEQVICLRGNHDDMMISYARYQDPTMIYNDGNKTIDSYGKATKLYGKNSFYYALVKSGHYDWTLAQPYYYETEDYFFSHAPIPKYNYRRGVIAQLNFRQDIHTLTWSYESLPNDVWIDPDPTTENKLCVCGHIHGMYEVKNMDKDGRVTREIVVPGVRQVGRSVLIDTGAGCHENGYLTCLELPSMITYDSNGKVVSLI